MEKLGVQFDDEKTKTAGSSRTCPKCGRDLLQDRRGEPYPKCPVCGTEPFEKRPPTKE